MPHKRFFSRAGRNILRSSARRSAPLITLLLATGCAVNQRKEVHQYREVLDGNTPPAVADTYDSQPLSLEEALVLANRRNEQLGISGETYVQALISKQRAFSAFLPTVSLAPAFTWVSKLSPVNNTSTSSGGSGSGSGSSVITTSGNKYFSSNVPIVANANVFNGFSDAATLAASGYTAEQRKAELLDLQQTIFLDVAQTYYQVLSAERSVVVLNNSVKVQDARVADMQDRERAGVARPLDVAQSEADDANTRTQLITAQENVKNGRTMLAYLIDAPVQNAVLVDRLTVPGELAPVEAALKVARDVRPDIAAARQGVEGARQQVIAALGEYYPSVSVNLEYFLHRDAIPTDALWEGFLNVNLPLFDAGIIYANVRQAWSELRVARLNEQMVVRQADQLVRTGYDTLVASRARLAELKIEVKASSDALYQAEQSYKAGLDTNLDVLTAQDSLLTAQLSLAAEELNYKFYYLQLVRAIGLLVRPENIIPATMPTTEPSSVETTTPGLPTSQQTGQPSMQPPPIVPMQLPPETQPTTLGSGPDTQPAATQPVPGNGGQ
jgi:outer membrane protein TolC